MKRKTDNGRHLVGTWISCDPWASSVEHRVTMAKGKIKVVAIDTEDSEKAEVYDVRWDGDRLNYCLHWKSTGRFSKNSLILLEKDKVGMTFTYTDQEILHRKTRDKASKAQHAIAAYRRQRGSG